jgi:hypothetical protein
MSEDRTNDTLIAYGKNGDVVAQGTMGDGSVVIDNLKPATSYSAGDFMVAFSNKNGVSDKVAVPAFETKAVPTQSGQSTPPASSAGEPTSPASSQASEPVSSASQPTEAQPVSSAGEVESEKPSQASSAESASPNSAQPASQAK